MTFGDWSIVEVVQKTKDLKSSLLVFSKRPMYRAFSVEVSGRRYSLAPKLVTKVSAQEAPPVAAHGNRVPSTPSAVMAEATARLLSSRPRAYSGLTVRRSTLLVKPSSEP